MIGNKICNLLVIFAIILTLQSCIPGADKKFGDQHFKTAIALIELHKVRYGEYPKSLVDLKYVGDWDKIIFNSVKYEKLEVGYALDLERGWLGKPERIDYPDEFWKGLGLKKSNMKK